MLYVGSVEQLENCTLEMEMRKIVAVLARWLSLKVTGVTIGNCMYAPFLCVSPLHFFKLHVANSINMFSNKSNIHFIKSHITKGSIPKRCQGAFV